MKATITENDIVNYWLKKYHGVSLEDVIEKHPEYKEDSRKFYTKYKVSQEQHDEWHEWMIQILMKQLRRGRKFIEKYSAFIYLNTSPSVKGD